MVALRRWAAALVLVVVPAWALAQARIPGPDRAAIDAIWAGEWSAEGFVFGAELHLQLDGSNGLDGYIRWTLTQSPRQNEQTKIGLTGLEFVRGAYIPAGRVLQFEGYRKDDPNQILGLDKYRLLLADNDEVLAGITEAHRSWTGVMFLKRKWGAQP